VLCRLGALARRLTRAVRPCRLRRLAEPLVRDSVCLSHPRRLQGDGQAAVEIDAMFPRALPPLLRCRLPNVAKCLQREACFAREGMSHCKQVLAKTTASSARSSQGHEFQRKPEQVDRQNACSLTSGSGRAGWSAKDCCALLCICHGNHPFACRRRRADKNITRALSSQTCRTACLGSKQDADV
jgi:hypothetical protein